MPKVGIEPTYPRVHDFESCASACSATPARCSSILANPFAGQEISGSSYSIKFAYREKKGHKKESSIHN